MLAAGTRFGPYEIGSLLGQGGMGEVYRARDPRLHRDVALKVLPPAFAGDPERVARFAREAQTLAALRHPNIAVIYGVEEQDSQRALVMELVEGETLADRVGRGAIEWREALALAIQLAEAVAAAHERGIIHRDLKPANVKQTSDGAIKVLDFGLAKAINPLASDDSVSSGANAPTLETPAMTRPAAGHATQDGVILGTVAYMSPEQARGGVVDRRTDVWAFGCVLYELLTGRQAFAGNTASDTLAAVLRGEPGWDALPRDLPSGVTRVLERCLARDRSARAADLHDVALDLADALRPTRDADTHATAKPSPRAVPMAVTLIAGLVAGAGLAWTLRPATVPRETTRFTFTLPASVELTNGGGPFGMAFSRDGRQLFFSASDRGSRPQIFRASLDAFEIQPIPGGERMEGATVSADGRWLFASQGDRVFRLPVDGGTPTQVTGAKASMAVAGPDRRLYFVADDGRALMAVSEDGGAPVAIADSGQRLINPYPLDGGWVLAVKDTTTEIVAVDPTNHGVSVLLAGRSPAVTASGHLVFFRDGSLWAARFKPPAGIVGDPQPVLSNVSANGFSRFTRFANAFALSPQGHLALVSEDTRASRRLLWVSRTGVTTSAFDESSDFAMLRLSPDGTRAAVVERDGISILDLARSTRVRLPEDGTLKRRPVWNPDGRTVAYQAQGDIFQEAADGTGHAVSLVTSSESEFPDSWSPDGTTLLLNEGGAVRDLAALKDGKKTTIVATGASERSGMFHPSGKWIAFVSDDSGRDELYLLRWPSAGGKVPISSRGGTSPVWSRDGREIFYREDTRMMAVKFNPDTGTLSSPEPLFDLRAFVLDSNLATWDVGPDGRFLMIEAASSAQRDAIRVILNWTEELKKKLPD